MIVRKLRLQRGWSQEHLAALTGLTSRTIQRLERGQRPSLDSQQALAAVFEVDISTFIIGDKSMHTHTDHSLPAGLADDEKEALEYVKGLVGFYSHSLAFIALAVLAAFVMSPTSLLFLLVFGGWLIGLVFHALNAFEVLKLISVKWERKLVERYLGRKL